MLYYVWFPNRTSRTKVINQSAGVGIKAVKPELNTDKVDGIVNIVSGKANFDDIKYMLIDPVINFSQCIVDDTVQANAKQHYKAGLNPKIKRTTTGKCCKWCSDVAGTLDYEEAKKTKDIFRRHKCCRCLVEYLPGDGWKQDVHTKAWSREVKSGIIQKRQYAGLKVEDSITKQIREEVIPKQKIDNVVEHQDIHRKGTSLYEKRKRQLEEKGQYGPSYVTISDDEIIYLVAKYSGTGIIRYDNKEEWNHQETIITNDKVIGIVVDNRNGNFAETSVFKIHYEKKGIHIVPDYPSKKR